VNVRISGLFAIATFAAVPGQARAAELTTVVNFDGTNGGFPAANLVADCNGNLFGTTPEDGAYGYGTVFEIAKTAGGYASNPTTLVNFNGADGSLSTAGLIADAKGNLFGTAETGGANGQGTVFEIAKTAGGYASTPLSWPASIAPMVPSRPLACSPTATATCSVRHPKEAPLDMARYSRLPRPPGVTPAPPPRWSTLAALTVPPQSPT
jgi:uncharacterized repeat protein (TIGR03803 family)